MSQIWRLAMNYDESTRECATVFHIKSEVTLSGDLTAEAVIDEIGDWGLITKWAACLTTDGHLHTVTVTEELAPGSTAVPDQAIRSPALTGARSTSDACAMELCAWYKTRTNAAVRGAHGGFFGPPVRESAAFSGANGAAQALDPYFINLNLFRDALLAGHDHTALAIVDNHLSYVIYSRTRRARGDANWFFDAVACNASPWTHFLRSRAS